MLQKMGWKEGHGLGSCGKGIREPVGMYAAGLGGCTCLREEVFSVILGSSPLTCSLILGFPHAEHGLTFAVIFY